MKKMLLPLFSLFLVVALLANTAGITVYNHFCKEEGETSISLVKLENCCPEKKHEVAKAEKHACCKKKSADNQKSGIQKNDCCSQDAFTAQFKLNEFSFYKNIFIFSPSFTIPSFVLNEKITNPVTFNFHIAESPPLIRSSVSILHQHSTLII